MKFFIDTANLAQIKEVQATGKLDVVTTLLAPILELLKHDLTDKGLTKFLEDHAKNNS